MKANVEVLKTGADLRSEGCEAVLGSALEVLEEYGGEAVCVVLALPNGRIWVNDAGASMLSVIGMLELAKRTVAEAE